MQCNLFDFVVAAATLYHHYFVILSPSTKCISNFKSLHRYSVVTTTITSINKRSPNEIKLNVDKTKIMISTNIVALRKMTLMYS